MENKHWNLLEQIENVLEKNLKDIDESDTKKKARKALILTEIHLRIKENESNN